ncbi:hypothetical protein [Herpetosiphon gulosus]|uniref:Apea-like HEPN domain-containing protein n=1 Tax=Herpetosiphon gulosus TaxID=1973496 RepID=A0ABP9WU96_9CHLR
MRLLLLLVILENISIIESIDNKNQLTILPSPKILLDKKVIGSQLNNIKNEIKYSLSILNKIRSKIVHKGYNYSIDMPYYIQILEGCLHRSIDRIIKRVINDVGKYQNIMDIVPTYNVPW